MAGFCCSARRRSIPHLPAVRRRGHVRTGTVRFQEYCSPSRVSAITADLLGQTTRRAAMRIRTWQPAGQLMAPPPGPVGPPCCVPCCCVVALVSPLLLAAAPVRAVRAAAQSRRSQPHIATVKHATGPRPDSRAARLLCCGIRFYQAELSPLTPPCPQTPSCSQYAAE